jgi:hypothetical protein
MTNVFRAVKQSVTTRQAAESYGIRVNRNGMAVCPFHNDKNPSMKVDQRFHCFACQADGDVIDFTSRLYGLSCKEAAEKLAADFLISYGTEGQRPLVRKPVKPQVSTEVKFRQTEQRCCRILSDYLHLLECWKREYAPKQTDEIWHPYFIEALQKISYVEYSLDVLLFGEIEEKAAWIAEKGKQVMKIEKRISEFTARNTAGGFENHRRYGTGTVAGGSQEYAGSDTKGWCEEHHQELPDRIPA